MPITSTAVTIHEDGWAYNAFTTNASSGLAVIAAPGAGRALVLKELHITSPLSARASIESKASATATVTRYLGPIMVNASGYAEKFLGGIRLVTNEELDFRTSASGNLQVYVAGYTL